MKWLVINRYEVVQEYDTSYNLAKIDKSLIEVQLI